MKVVGIIPARYKSSRFKGKALADICGMPMIQHVYEQAKKARLLDNLIVATDDRRIYNTVINFGVSLSMNVAINPDGIIHIE